MNQRLKRLKVILIGDSCIDEYHYGTVDRISPEAPVPIFIPKKVVTKHGMAANVAENLKVLGVEVITFFGQNSTKIRLIDAKTKQHLYRIDKDIQSTCLSPDTVFPEDVDAFIISDYNKGMVSYELIERLLLKGIPVIIDTKKTDLKKFEGAIVKINSIEYSAAKTLPSNVIITMGRDGVKWGDKEYDAIDVEISDVCGAGDTFLASFAYQYLQTNSIDHSIRFAIKASSITVQHTGVYAPSLEEIS